MSLQISLILATFSLQVLASIQGHMAERCFFYASYITEEALAVASGNPSGYMWTVAPGCTGGSRSVDTVKRCNIFEFLKYLDAPNLDSYKLNQQLQGFKSMVNTKDFARVSRDQCVFALLQLYSPTTKKPSPLPVMTNNAKLSPGSSGYKDAVQRVASVIETAKYGGQIGQDARIDTLHKLAQDYSILAANFRLRDLENYRLNLKTTKAPPPQLKDYFPPGTTGGPYATLERDLGFNNGKFKVLNVQGTANAFGLTIAQVTTASNQYFADRNNPASGGHRDAFEGWQGAGNQKLQCSPAIEGVPTKRMLARL